jgi:hypothetical protein
MRETENKKCAHAPCTCTGEGKYCSTACEEAGSDEVEIACECGHPHCAASIEAKSAKSLSESYG